MRKILWCCPAILFVAVGALMESIRHGADHPNSAIGKLLGSALKTNREPARVDGTAWSVDAAMYEKIRNQTNTYAVAVASSPSKIGKEASAGEEEQATASGRDNDAEARSVSTPLNRLPGRIVVDHDGVERQSEPDYESPEPQMAAPQSSNSRRMNPAKCQGRPTADDLASPRIMPYAEDDEDVPTIMPHATDGDPRSTPTRGNLFEQFWKLLRGKRLEVTEDSALTPAKASHGHSRPKATELQQATFPYERQQEKPPF